jgi:ribonuclease HI
MTHDHKPIAEIFADGACSRRAGGSVIPFGPPGRNFQDVRMTTNNRMELMASYRPGGAEEALQDR